MENAPVKRTQCVEGVINSSAHFGAATRDVRRDVGIAFVEHGGFRKLPAFGRIAGFEQDLLPTLELVRSS